MKTVLDTKEIIRFLIAGFSAVGTDFFVYNILLIFLTHSPAKVFSFISGSCIAFVINKYWTFKKEEKSLKEIVRFSILYIITLIVNTGVNKIFLTLIPGFVWFAFLVATGASTILNFIGQKWWVFIKKN